MTQLLSILEVALGVGFLILFHEYGHFVVARLSGVRVETFSIGFGPRLLGWRRGPTDYRVSVIPLGGYVKLAGDSPASAGKGAPDELGSKGVGARAGIFLAGVGFNALFSFLLFPVLFRIGVPFLEPVAGEVTPGGPAWEAGIEPGTRILEVAGTPVYAFEQIGSMVALAEPGPLLLRIRTPGGEERGVVVRPEQDAERGLQALQIDPPLDPARAIDLDPKGPAAAAGLRTGDRLASVGDARGEDLLRSLEGPMRRGEALEVTVEREGYPLSVRIVPRERQGSGHQIGIAPALGRVRAVREPFPRFGVLPGDRLVSVNGRPLLEEEDRRALLAEEGGALRFVFEREGIPYECTIGAATPEDRRRALDAIALEADGARIVPVAGLPADRSGLRRGDRILAVNGRAVREWREIFDAVADAGTSPVLLTVERGEGSPLLVEVKPEPRGAFDYGFGIRRATYVYRTENFLSACGVGIRCSVGLVQDFWLALRRIFTRKMAASNLSGIVSIAALSYQFSQVSFAKFLFFLGILSLNLALINLLPVPMLDGGHLLFLGLEKLKGSPVSERVQTIAQVVGLTVIGGLVLFVTWHDVRRWLL